MKPTVKKIFLVFLFCIAGATGLFAQVDSVAIIEEMQQLKRVNDSLYRVQLAKDTAFSNSLDESMRKERREAAEETISEPLSKLEKKEQARQNILKWALLGMLGFLVIAALLANRKKQNKRTSRRY